MAALAALSQPMALGEVAALGSSVDASRDGLRPAFGVPRVTESPTVCPERLVVRRAGCVVRLAALAALSQPMALGEVAALGSSVDAWRNGLRPAFGVPRVTESV